MMKKLTVSTGDAVREVPYLPGASLRDTLEAVGLPVRSGCRGNGACGLCLVRIEAGDVNDLTSNERLVLSTEQVERGTRLACQVMPASDLCVRRVSPVCKPRWRVLAGKQASASASHAASNGSANYGLAVDLGTTHLSVSLCDLDQGKRLCGRIGSNPQSRYGADVMTRLIAAGESSDTAREIARLPLEAIAEAVHDMELREGIRADRIRQVSIVGNTPMLTLLTEMNARVLLQPSAWAHPVECRPANPQVWAGEMGVHPEAVVEVVSPIAGFVGSDLLAGVLCTDLTRQPGSLLIDFGTNSEMALWDGKTLWVTSAAGGPAFESCGMRCGMPAEAGAIYHVARQENLAELRFEVLEGGRARGFCGSGLVDLVAVLRDAAVLTAAGKFAAPQPAEGFLVQGGDPAIWLTLRDVDTFQRAKAGIGVGIRKLLAAAGMSAVELSRLCVCGVFGEHLNCRNAQAIGLLPGLPVERIELCGNTALAGCERLLLSPTTAAEVQSLRQRASIVGLAETPDFEMLFMDSLYLRPLTVDVS
jgi:uncharacterized 2Fe-2S/4Fe-4S cluster protein (DUF4445 family)